MSIVSSKNLKAWTSHLDLLKSRPFVLLWIFLLAFTVRGLTANFVKEHLYDPGWFQVGTYEYFDRRAEDILDHKAFLFFINDPSRTEAAVYPPGYPIWVAFLYKITGQHAPETVQAFQWVLDAWAVLLIVAVATVFLGWHFGVITGVLVALSPLLALYGATPLADAPTSWFVIGGALLLLLAAKRQHIGFALGAGALVGASCWFRGNAFLLPLFWSASLLLIPISWKQKGKLAGALLAGALVIVAPILVRNAIAFHAFTPTGLGAGTNLWEGIGETDRAAEFGAVYGDEALLEQERSASSVSPEQPFTLYSPNGVERDRERGRKAMKVIASHPFWYGRVMLRRMIGVLKYAGQPKRYYGSAGINVTRQKVLPENLQHGPVAWIVTVMGMVQSVLRYLALPLMALGIWLALKRHWRLTLILLSTVIYYLVVGSALHTEIRYGLPMQAVLFVFGGLGAIEIFRFLANRFSVAHASHSTARSHKKKRSNKNRRTSE